MVPKPNVYFKDLARVCHKTCNIRRNASLASDVLAGLSLEAS